MMEYNLLLSSPQHLQRASTESQKDMEKAIAASLSEAKDNIMDRHTKELKEVKHLHDTDLFKTQCLEQSTPSGEKNVLVLVKFPTTNSNLSCGRTRFKTGTICLSYKSIVDTGSGVLVGLLSDEQHQRRAKKSLDNLLPAGVTHILDLSPTTEEDDHITALQNLSIPRSVKLWHRSMVSGTSLLAVAGHDDVCDCLLPTSGLLDFDCSYPLLEAPKDIESNGGNVCIFDTEKWPVDKWGNIGDFCTTRWAANTIRLFRAIAKPAGEKDLLIDSAPRLWTLVGLFTKLEMTNYDILVSTIMH